MRAEDVPADLVESASQKEFDREMLEWAELFGGPPMEWGEASDELRQNTREMVAAVLSSEYVEIQARILEELADGLIPGELSKYDRRYVEDWLRFTAQALRDGPPGARDA